MTTLTSPLSSMPYLLLSFAGSLLRAVPALRLCRCDSHCGSPSAACVRARHGAVNARARRVAAARHAWRMDTAATALCRAPRIGVTPATACRCTASLCARSSPSAFCSACYPAAARLCRRAQPAGTAVCGAVRFMRAFCCLCICCRPPPPFGVLALCCLIARAARRAGPYAASPATVRRAWRAFASARAATFRRSCACCARFMLRMRVAQPLPPLHLPLYLPRGGGRAARTRSRRTSYLVEPAAPYAALRLAFMVHASPCLPFSFTC